MSLREQMILTNIACDETSGVDIGGNWIEDDVCHIALRFNEDDEEDIEFHMLLNTESIETLRDFLNYKLSTQPKTIN